MSTAQCKAGPGYVHFDGGEALCVICNPKPKTMSNKYHSAGYKTAEELLAAIRPEVDTIFIAMGINNPPSQFARSKVALERIEATLELARAEKAYLSDDARMARRWRDTIRDFRAVHRTVWILEGRAL